MWRSHFGATATVLLFGPFFCHSFAFSDADKTICVCQCGGSKELRKRASEAGIAYPDEFFVILFLEAVFQAAVHSFDRKSFESYRKKVEFDVRGRAHDGSPFGSCYPQTFLCGVEWGKAWKAARLEKTVGELTEQWLKAYTSLYGREAATLVIRGIAGDGHLSSGPYNQLVPVDVSEAYMNAFKRATLLPALTVG